MAEKSTAKKRRGPYRVYLRHSNPYKFPASRRKKIGKQCLHEIDRAPTITQNDEDLEFNDGSDDSTFVVPTSNEPAAFGEENEQCCSVGESCELYESESEDENLESSLYERFMKDDDSSSDVFSSDNENIESDSESIMEEHETEHEDVLYSGASITITASVVLILSFVMKHHLTREAFRDLLRVIEAHCPRPNKCKTEIKKLFEFVSQAKGNIVRHFFCTYCKAYACKGTQDSQLNGTCHICGKSLANTHGFFIEVPIVEQVKIFFQGKCSYT